MEEFKKQWFQAVWAGLVLASLAVHYIQRWVDAAWAQSHAMDVLDDVLGWICLPMTVILFILKCVENWRVGRRYFWRVCRRWGGALLGGTLMAAVLVALVKFFKSGWVFDGNIYDTEVKIFLFVLFSLGGLLYMIARYKFNHPNND